MALGLRRRAAAAASGALRPIATTRSTVAQAGIPFAVSLPAGPTPLARAEVEKPAYREDGFDPFLPPYDPALYVSGLTPTHVCLLNKYNVLDCHLLAVTRAFEHQETWLTLADFAALWLCLAEFDALAFYNAGKAAGASQRHKHLQVVPLPLLPGESSLPAAPAFEAVRWAGDFGATPAFPFVHALARLDPAWTAAPQEAAQHTLALYWALLARVGVPRGEGACQTRPYNLLMTRQWMLLVPRRQEAWGGIAVNALGFAGSLMVWDAAGTAPAARGGAALRPCGRELPTIGR